MNNTSDNYSISVVIPAYNAAEHISRTIYSVAGQTFPAKEIIVIDDGSTDSTSEVVKSFGEKVQYIYQQNAGVSAARNAGIEAATSEWIAFLDADDLWIADKTERQVDLFSDNPEIGVCTGEVPWVLDSPLRMLHGRYTGVDITFDKMTKEN